MIKFLLSGNGCIDPYSTYFQFVVEIDDLKTGELRWLDRSAHSFITRMIIRSQGVELERIENYDVIAAMINDMIYSPEQATQHYWEAFPTHTWEGPLPYAEPKLVFNEGTDVTKGYRLEPNCYVGLEQWGAIKADDREGDYYFKGITDNALSVSESTQIPFRDELFRWLC